MSKHIHIKELLIRKQWIRPLAVCWGLLFFSSLQAQPGNPAFGLVSEMSMTVDMQPIAILDIESSGASSDMTFNLTAPSEAGASPDTSMLVNSANWINYSSADRDVSSRHIEVGIGSGSVPAGLQLILTAGTSTGGAGSLGSPVSGGIILSGTPVTLISGIQGGYTGNGSGNGHQLTFRLRYLDADFDLISHQNTPLIITYTFMDD